MTIPLIEGVMALGSGLSSPSFINDQSHQLHKLRSQLHTLSLSFPTSLESDCKVWCFRRDHLGTGHVGQFGLIFVGMYLMLMLYVPFSENPGPIVSYRRNRDDVFTNTSFYRYVSMHFVI